MLEKDETRTNGQTLGFCKFSLNGFLAKASVPSLFLNLMFSWIATTKPIKPNKINGNSLFVYLNIKAPISGPRTVPKTNPDSRFENTTDLFSGDEIRPA